MLVLIGNPEDLHLRLDEWLDGSPRHNCSVVYESTFN